MTSINSSDGRSAWSTRVQLRTVKELKEVKSIERPVNVAALDETFKKAPKAKVEGHEQAALEF